MTGAPAALIAVDGGNSKTDLAVFGFDGAILGAAHGPTMSHEQVGLEGAMASLEALLGRLPIAGDSGVRRREPLAKHAVLALAGADTLEDVDRLAAAVSALGLAETTTVVNDSEAALRAGSSTGWGIAVICGQGVNAIGISPAGATARFEALGDISGDWGGGADVGLVGLAAAVRALDGRGEPTLLSSLVPEHFGVGAPVDVTHAVDAGEIPRGRLGELAPVVFRAADEGDAVATGIVLRLADELATMVGALAARLEIADLPCEVVLAGGVFRATNPAFTGRLRSRIRAAIPSAGVAALELPPVVGSAMIGLDRLRVSDPSAAAAIQRTLDGLTGRSWPPGESRPSSESASL